MVTDLEKVPMQYRGSMKVLLPGEPINQGAAAAGQYVTSQSQQQSDPRVTPIEIVNSLVFVPVTLTYQGRTVTTRLLLDTGATGVTISPAIAQRLGAYSGSPMTITLADGRKVMSFQFACEQVSVGLKTKINSRVCVMPRDDSEEVGLLGMEFLSEFSHSIDTKAKVIRWL
jgi:predicted aspartyl protease